MKSKWIKEKLWKNEKMNEIMNEWKTYSKLSIVSSGMQIYFLRFNFYYCMYLTHMLKFYDYNFKNIINII